MNDANIIKVVKAIYAGINAGDIPAILKFLDRDIERIEPEGFPTSGTYRGHAELEKQFTDARATWAEGACEPTQFYTNGAAIVASVHVKVRLKDETKWIDALIADGFVFHGDKVKSMVTFASQSEALEWLERQG